MAASLSSPGNSSSSSFDPYSENMADARDNHHSSLALDRGRKSTEMSQGSPTGGEDGFSNRTSDMTDLPHRTTMKSSWGHPEQQVSVHKNPHRKRKRDTVAVGRPEKPRMLNLDVSSGHNGHGIGAEPQSDSPSSSVDGNKRIKFGAGGQLVSSVDGYQPVHGMPKDKSKLPRELWQHIFTFLPPASLGRVLQINRSFHALLTPGQVELPNNRATPGSLKCVSPNSIWSASRKTFHSGMPRPLLPLTELDMWRLVRGTSCQFCSKANAASIAPDALPWESGPGDNGVRIIWPFAVRSCGDCLKQKCKTEMDLLFYSTLPSLLVPALPFAFFTPSMHYASSVSLRGSQPPTGLVLSKLYSKAQVEEMKSRFEEVKALGSAAAEEWIKGLEGNGKEKIADAARWEQWELSGGLRSLETIAVCQPDFHTDATARPEHNVQGSNESVISHTTYPNDRIPDRRGSPTVTSNNFDIFPRPPSVGGQPSFPLPTQNVSHPRAERNLRQVNESKANRKAEIERRCAELDPPLAPSVLGHMESFIAAIQIPHPFTDRDWDILKPRLLAQREVAERRDAERKMQDVLIQAKSEERRQQEAQQKEAKEVLDREWDDIQKPIRDRMAQYADEIIRKGWRGGDGVTKEKCSKFAADVLMYVRTKFYDDLAKDDAQARLEGKPIEEDTSSGPPRPKLILENMKFIFDTKIKPLTEQFQKELFLCNGCENNAKFYGFEGVIQHYAAKHTNVLSLGSVVVHWRAEWPERPPFHPDPDAAKALLYAMPRPPMGHGYHATTHGAPQDPIGYPQPSPGPYGSRTPYGTPYAYGSGPYRPPSPPSQYYPTPQGGYGYSPPQPPFPSSAQYDQHAPPPPPPPQIPSYGSPFPGQAYPPPYAEQRPQHPPYQHSYGGKGHTGGSYAPSYPPTQGAPPAGSHKPNQGSQSFGLYQSHLDDIAKNARNIWNSTSGIKDLPHNVRAHVVIHHVTSRFVERFGQEPALALFADGLNCHPQMKPIRNLSGLICKTCADASNPRRFRPHDSSRGDRKIYTLPALISHFQSVHTESTRPMTSMQGREDASQPDWRVHMLALPDNSTVASLAQAPGMDQVKFHLIKAAFPWVFSPAPAPPPKMAQGGSKAPDIKRPIPEVGGGGQIKADQARLSGDVSADIKPSLSSPNRRGLEVAVDGFSRFVESPGADGVKPFAPPKDDEYDPHRPGFVEPMRDSHRRVGTRPYTNPGPSTLAQGSTEPDHRVHSLRSDRRHPAPTHQPADSRPMDNSGKQPGFSRPKYTSGPSKGPVQNKERFTKSEFGEIETTGNDGNTLRPSTRIHSRSRNVSEDGEVSESHQSHDIKPEAPSPVEEMNAAERFLSNFIPGKGHDGYKHGSNETDKQPTEYRGKWIENTESDDRKWRMDAVTNPVAERNLAGTPIRKLKPNSGGRGGRTMSPAIARGYRDLDPRHESFEVNNIPTPRRGEMVSPDPNDPRHGRRALAVPEAKHQPGQARRPTSRFDRYEAQRQGPFRPRSRSPIPPERIPLEPNYYRDRSPKARNRAHPPYPPHTSEAYHERLPIDNPASYARMQSQGQYRYVEDYAEPPYDGTVEYVPVRMATREPQNPGPYYIERPIHRGVPEYVDYDMEYTRQPVIEDHGQYYSAPADIPDMPSSGARRARYR